MDTDARYQELRRALGHLGDTGYLTGLTGLTELGIAQGEVDLTYGHAVRRTITLAIDALAPMGQEGERGLDSLAHEVLYQYAIGGKTVVAVANQMGMSERHAYRNGAICFSNSD